MFFPLLFTANILRYNCWRVIQKEWHNKAGLTLLPCGGETLQCSSRAWRSAICYGPCSPTGTTGGRFCLEVGPSNRTWRDELQTLLLTVCMFLSRAFPLVAVAAVVAPLQGGQGAVCQAAGLHTPLGALKPVLLWGGLRRWGQVWTTQNEEYKIRNKNKK